jgi:hypothetical protein
MEPVQIERFYFNYRIGCLNGVEVLQREEELSLHFRSDRSKGGFDANKKR